MGRHCLRVKISGLRGAIWVKFTLCDRRMRLSREGIFGVS